MSQTAQKEVFKLSRLDRALLTKFQNLLKLEHVDTFTSDDFRMYDLDKHFENPQQDIGSWFAKMVHHRKIVDTGERVRSLLPRNNMREIKVYRMNQP